MFTNASVSQWAVHPMKDCTVFSAVQVSVVNDMDQFISGSSKPSTNFIIYLWNHPFSKILSRWDVVTFLHGSMSVTSIVTTARWILTAEGLLVSHTLARSNVSTSNGCLNVLDEGAADVDGGAGITAVALDSCTLCLKKKGLPVYSL